MGWTSIWRLSICASGMLQDRMAASGNTVQIVRVSVTQLKVGRQDAYSASAKGLGHESTARSPEGPAQPRQRAWSPRELDSSAPLHVGSLIL